MSIAFAVDTTQATVRLESVEPKVRRAVQEVVTADTVKLWNIVRLKLSDDILHVRTGNLRRSIQQEAETSQAGTTGRVFSDASVDYARIHEYGGKIDIPEIVPKTASALAFMYEGKLVFARRVKAHTVTIPPRSYMRSSLHEFAPRFEADMRMAVAVAAK